MPKPASNPTDPPAATPRAADARSTPSGSPPPRRLADIPGLGPIRLRALQKAGLDNLSALRAASLATLLAVPGLTEIKARHIQTFLAPFKNLPKAEPAPVGKSASSSLVQWETSPAAAPALSPLAAEAVHALGQTARFLLGVHAPQFRNRLLRELARFAERAETLILEPGDLQAAEQEQRMRQLRRGGEEFIAADAQPELDRKTQSKLADTLAEINIALGAPADTEPAKEKEKSKSHV